MKNKVLKLTLSFLILSGVFIFSNSNTIAHEQKKTMVVYFTGIGCSHCAKIDQVLLNDWINKYEELVVVEYEIYQQSKNSALLDSYHTYYDSGYGIPLIIFNKNLNISGDRSILANFEKKLSENDGNDFSLNDGKQIEFMNLDFNSLPLYPKIWQKDRIAIKEVVDSNISNNLLRNFLITDQIKQTLENEEFQLVIPQKVTLSGSNIEFENAIQVNGWLLQWNGEALEGEIVDSINRENESLSSENSNKIDLTLGKTLSLAIVDAINPCALAVLTMMLIAIITYNPKDKKNIILAGLAFSTAVFVMYLLYGLIIIKIFQLIQAITSARLILYKILAIVAILLGVLQIKDFISYKAGSIGTEMPLFMRPKVKKIISGITSPKGAFGIGLFVTVFLLPCTIGPYIILGGMLSFVEVLKTLPYLLIYNFIFILPMLVITIVVYAGISKVENVSEWKDKNIRTLHLVSGIIIALLGVTMFLGWV